MTKVLFSEPDQLLHYDWKDIKRKISFHALRRGKPGRILNTFITGKDHKVQLSNDSTNEEYLKDKENLMADILDVIPSSILEKLEDKLDTYIVQADVLGLWKDLNELYEADKEEVYKRFYRRTKRNAFAVLISTLTGEYIERSWTTITESEDLRNDVVSLNGSVALVSALVLTIVLPMFLDAAQSTDNDLEIAYCFFCAMATMLESISVLLTVRNLIAMSLLNIDDIKIYVTKATWVMMAPLKLHIYAVMILLAALVVFAFNVIDANLVIGFLCIFLIPALTYYLVSSSYSAKYVLDLKDEDVHFKLPLNHLPHINKSNVNNSNINEHHQAKIYPTTEKETNNN